MTTRARALCASILQDMGPLKSPSELLPLNQSAPLCNSVTASVVEFASAGCPFLSAIERFNAPQAFDSATCSFTPIDRHCGDTERASGAYRITIR